MAKRYSSLLRDATRDEKFAAAPTRLSTAAILRATASRYPFGVSASRRSRSPKFRNFLGSDRLALIGALLKGGRCEGEVIARGHRPQKRRYRYRVAVMGERGVSLAASTVLRWAQQYLKIALTDASAQSFKKKVQLIRCRAMRSAHFDVDALHASRLVSAQFPDIRAENAEPFGGGWDNVAFLVDGKVVFRFPRSRYAAGLIEREIAVLSLVAPQLPVDISAPSYIGAASRDYPWIFAGYKLIAGTTACSAQLTDAARITLAEPLARFLRVLHDIEPAPLVARGLASNQMGRFDKKRLRLTRERLPMLAGATGISKLDAFVTWLEAHPPVLPDVGKRRLVHGDLYARHVVLDANAHLMGVIDWGDVHLGDPAIDIAIAHLMLPSSAHTAFRAAYGPVDDRTWTAARYRAISHAIIELDYGIRKNDAGMREAGSAALRLMEDSLV